MRQAETGAGFPGNCFSEQKPLSIDIASNTVTLPSSLDINNKGHEMSRSKVQAMLQMQEQMRQLEQQLAEMQQDEELIKAQKATEDLIELVEAADIDADTAVFALIKKFGREAVRRAVGTDEERKRANGATGRKRISRQTRYTNPETGEVLVQRRIHGPVLAWKEKFGLNALNPTQVD